MKKKVLYITCDSSLFGSNSSLLNLMNSLSGEIVPIVILPDNGPVVEILKERKIRYYIINFGRNCAIWNKTLDSVLGYIPRFILYTIKNLIAYKALVKIVNMNEIDIIHTNNSVISIGYEIAKRMNIKHVWHLREFQSLDHSLRPFWGFNHLIRKIKSSDKIICISQSIADFYNMSSKDVVFYNAVRSEKDILNLCEKENYFIFCGNLSASKGVFEALEAFLKFAESNEEVDLYFVGSFVSKTDQNKINKIIDNTPYSSRIHFLGFRKDVASLMNKARALLMCSKNEAMGRVTAEAMLNNCFVIGYSNAGTSELIVHDQTGVLYENTAQLIECMKKYSYESSFKTEIVNKAKKYAIENFVEEVYSLKILSVYNSL